MAPSATIPPTATSRKRHAPGRRSPGQREYIFDADRPGDIDVGCSASCWTGQSQGYFHTSLPQYATTSRRVIHDNNTIRPQQNIPLHMAYFLGAPPLLISRELRKPHDIIMAKPISRLRRRQLRDMQALRRAPDMIFQCRRKFSMPPTYYTLAARSYLSSSRSDARSSLPRATDGH